jgi:hypothetical protein
VKRAVVQIGHVTLFAKPVAKSGRGEWRAKLCGQKTQMSARRRIYNGPQGRMNRNGELNPGAALGLRSRPTQHFIFDVLRSHRDHILPSLPGVEPER